MKVGLKPETNHSDKMLDQVAAPNTIKAQSVLGPQGRFRSYSTCASVLFFFSLFAFLIWDVSTQLQTDF